MIALRRISAVAVTLWIIGIPIVAVFPLYNAGDTAPPSIVVWVMLPVWGALAAGVAFILGGVLFSFYMWALGSSEKEERSKRIERLERELGIPTSLKGRGE